jgi:hypothetical protein
MTTASKRRASMSRASAVSPDPHRAGGLSRRRAAGARRRAWRGPGVGGWGGASDRARPRTAERRAAGSPGLLTRSARAIRGGDGAPSHRRSGHCRCWGTACNNPPPLAADASQGDSRQAESGGEGPGPNLQSPGQEQGDSVMEAALLVVSLGSLRGIVFVIAGVLVVGVIAAQIHLFRRRHKGSQKETR